VQLTGLYLLLLLKADSSLTCQGQRQTRTGTEAVVLPMVPLLDHHSTANLLTVMTAMAALLLSPAMPMKMYHRSADRLRSGSHQGTLSFEST